MAGTRGRAKSEQDTESAYKRVGRLASLGLTERWQTALLLPSGLDDLRTVCPSLAAVAGHERAVIALRPAGDPRAYFKGAPRTVVPMADATGATMRCTVFGDTKFWMPHFLEGQVCHYLVRPEEFNGEATLRIEELVDPEWVGRLRPKYPGKPNYLAAEKVREVVIRNLPEALPQAASFIERELEPLVGRDRLLEGIGMPGWTLQQVIEEAHTPVSPLMHAAAKRSLQRVAAFAALAKAHSHRLSRPSVRALELSTLDARVRQLPFALTPDQSAAAQSIAADLGRPVAMRRVLIGDVGTGKTAVFGSAATAAFDAGGRVAILLPNLPLAEQVAREIRETWPDVPVCQVTGDSGPEHLGAERFMVGTTAMLHRQPGDLDFVIVDEEQKFSVEQREALATTSAHLLTSSATCIPRSQALAKYGALSLSEIRSTHVKKNVLTRLWAPEQRRELFGEIARFLEGDAQLLVVYPMREKGEDMDPRLSVEVAGEFWENKYPGRVRTLTGEDSDERKTQALGDMRANRAQILIATTVVEVGVTLPGLRRVLIVAPERHGLTQLHQLRGRCSRKGGDGWCDLFSPSPLSPAQSEKLEAFKACRDGFEVAELDLKLRGFGDLGRESKRQSGADDSFIFGAPITPEVVEEVEALWREALERA